jgi:putative protease
MTRTSDATLTRRPEILAPAGDEASLRVALACGADAVYFGLDSGFNARARAANFSTDGLAATVARIHRAGARAYLTLNTLVFERELEIVERLVVRAAKSGVDALIVQDPAVALIARAVCPDLHVHASTQMTVSSPEAAAFAETLGVRRVVVPRELSTAEIETFANATALELEVFVHGALCVSWSGQCLTSEAWGGRSANRGQCAQSCRMPYDLIVDGEHHDLGDVRYLLSPKDLAGVGALPALVAHGVRGLKIEGRQKGPAYVATAVTAYRNALEQICEHGDAGASTNTPPTSHEDFAAMALAYSRGFSTGFLEGADHQMLVEGRFPKHRGIYLGRVTRVRAHSVDVELDEDRRTMTGGLAVTPATPSEVPLAARALRANQIHAEPVPFLDPPKSRRRATIFGSSRTEGSRAPSVEPRVEPRAGMGIVFDAGHPEEEEAGGPLFGVAPKGAGFELSFGEPGPDLSRVERGHRVWLTSDPLVRRNAERLAADEREPEGRIPITLEVFGREGEPLRARASAHTPFPLHAHAESTSPLAAARGMGLGETLVREKLAAFGGTPFRLEALDVTNLEGTMHLPVSELKSMRRALETSLRAMLDRGPDRDVREGVLEDVRREGRERFERTARADTLLDPTRPPHLLALCRSDAQLEAVIEAGLQEVELDFMERVGLARAVERARRAGLRVSVATVRVQKPGEETYDTHTARLEPDGVLVRHWGALMYFARLPEAAARPALHGDFSLNVTNSVTAHHLFSLGLCTITLAHDLDRVQALALLSAAPAGRFTVALHHHIAAFHTEHCVYAHTLSRGRDFRTCGRPCEAHEISLRDRLGLEHPVIVDVGCRNTVFNAQAQSAASLVPAFLAAGVRRFRVELVRESRAEAARVLSAYEDLLSDRCSAAEAVRRAGVHEQFGVTRGTMMVLR